jgi:hypothetical protein
MTACERFEEEGLLRLEQGLPLDAHFASCPDCQAARQSYERLKSELASLDPAEPPARLEERVWNSISKKKVARRPLRVYLFPALGLAAAAMLVIFLLPPTIQQSGSPALAVDFRAGSNSVRSVVAPGSPVPPGTVLVLDAKPAGARYSDLRVYRNDDQLLLQSSGSTRVLLEVVGRYQAVLFTSNRPIPPPSTSVESDIRAAREAGAEVTLASPITVR